jgi:tetratricopeptide (TPR) repeat protein
MMNVSVLTLLSASALFAADEQQLALALRAQTDFQRVALSPAPQLHDTNVCIQSEAAMVAVATAEEAPLYHLRKGYCTLAASTITQEANGYLQAAWAFDQGIAAWPARNLALAKKRPAEPLPSVFPILAAVSRLKGGQGDVKPIAGAVGARVCNDSMTTPQTCDAIIQTGREWLAWSALQRNDFDAAAREIPTTSIAWAAWVAGKRAFSFANYAEAVTSYKRAVEAWNALAQPGASMPLSERFGPPVNLSESLAELGGAQLLAGDSAGALATLNQAVRRDGSNARALYLRARAQDAAGHTDQAIADYNLAARNALAKTSDEASGDAHVYRGIAFYRRKEFTKAEDEFNNALSFEIAPATRADAVAWRRLSAVAGGSCEVGRKYLEEALPAVSPFFPRDEARATIRACTPVSTAQRSQ